MMRHLPPVALFFTLAAGVAFSLGAGAYFLGANTESPSLATESVASCAPTLRATGVPGTFVVAAAADLALDAVESRWIRDASATPWRTIAEMAGGDPDATETSDGVAFTDADRSGTLSVGDAFTVSGANATGEFRCA